MRSIKATVGKGGANHPEDVRTVQTLLNQQIAKLVPFMPVIVSGYCDPQTIVMIEEFQRRVLLLKPDGRVDPTKRTIAALNGISSSALPDAPILREAPSLPSGEIATALLALTPFVTQTSHADAARYAITAYFNYAAAHPDSIKKPYLYFVDYGLNNQTRRGYVFDMVQLTLVEGPFTVAHGTGSSHQRNGVPTKFDNSIGSNATSLGLYVTLKTYRYTGHSDHKEYSSIGLRLSGKSGVFNSAAQDRGVVIHGAPYVTANDAGRSQGCPAMEMTRATRLIPLLAEGAVVFLFSPNNSEWIANDPWVHPSAT